MANCCEYDMMVVAKTKESIERFKSIMEYKDKEFFIYRVQDLVVLEEPNEQDGLWVAMFCGNVAWSCTPWVSAKPDPNHKSDLGASYTNLKELCKILDFGVEIWAREEGCRFQQYILINHNGEVCADDTESWEVEYDDDGEVVEEKGGFEEYDEWSFPEDVYQED